VNAAEIAKDRDIQIYTIGVGDPAASGEDRVDLATLQDIAGRTGGEYFFAEDEAGLEQVYDRIDELAPRQVETLSYRPRQPLAFILLAAVSVIGAMTVTTLALSSAHRGRPA